MTYDFGGSKKRGCHLYRVWLGNHFEDLSNKELIDLFTEIINAVPTASNNGFKPTGAA